MHQLAVGRISFSGPVDVFRALGRPIYSAAELTNSGTFQPRDNLPGICSLQTTPNRARDGPNLDLKIQIVDSWDVSGKR